MNQKPLPEFPTGFSIRRSDDGTNPERKDQKTSTWQYFSCPRSRHDNVSVNSYCDFVKSKLFFDIIKLKGEETHE